MYFVVRVCLCLLVATVATAINSRLFRIHTDLQEEFKQFKEKYKREYDDETEEELRMRIYVANKYEIDQHNERHDRGLESYTMEMNKFGDMLHHEFMLSHTLSIASSQPYATKPEDLPPLAYSFGSAIDWRKKFAVSPVRDVLECGSSHIVATVESLEAQNAKNQNKNVTALSVQEVIECSEYLGNEDCGYGIADDVYKYIKTSGGIQSEEDCPYHNNTKSCCNSTLVEAQFLELRSITSHEGVLEQVLFKVGPVAARIDSSKLQFYQSGIFYDKTCSKAYEDLDIAVLVVGFDDDENGVPYYIVKNSWGEDWGEKGYVRMARRRNNHCGIATAGTIAYARHLQPEDRYRMPSSLE